MGRRRTIRSDGGSPADAFVSGTPIDDDTEMPPPEEVELSREEGSKIPLDPESARVAKQHRDVMSRKAKGETGVRWNADGRIRYREAVTMHPGSMVSIRQLEPFEADNVPSRPVSLLKDYDSLIKHVKESHWSGERSTYKWVIGDAFQPQWATGMIHFTEDPNRAGAEMSRNQPPQYGYGYNVPYPMMPNPMTPMAPYAYFPQHPVPPAPPAPAPPAPVMSAMTGDPMSQLVTQISELTRANASLAEQVRQLQQQYQAQMYQWQLGQQYPIPHPIQPVPQGIPFQGYQGVTPIEPPKPVSPLQSAKDAVDTVVQLHKLSKDVTNTLTTPDLEKSQPIDDDFPLKVRDVGAFRMAALDGKMLTGLGSFATFNSDKIGSYIKDGLKSIKEVIGERDKQRQSEAMTQAAQRQQALADAERLAQIQERIARAETIKTAAIKEAKATNIQELPKEIPTIPDNTAVEEQNS